MAKHRSNWDASYEYGQHGNSKASLSTGNYIDADALDVDPVELLKHWRSLRTTNLDAQQITTRKERLAALTQPNMIGFFPVFDPSSEHARFAVSQFDTETADDNRQIVEIAGVQVIWNFTRNRFEQLPNASLANQFYRIYNPQGAAYDVTGSVHGYDAPFLEAMRQKFGMDKALPLAWNKDQLEEFKQWGKHTVFVGHNIYNADLAWIHNRRKNEFVYEEPNFKQGFLDTFHLAEAVYGRSLKGEGRNKLQNLARRLGVSAESLGLPAHAAWADSIINLKVFERIIQQNPQHPAVLEFLNGMRYGNLHSHRKSTPDTVHGSYLVTHTVNDRPLTARLSDYANALKKKFRVRIKEKYIQDLPSSLGISEEDFIEGNWDRKSYEEIDMNDIDEELKRSLDYFEQHGYGGKGISNEWAERLHTALSGLEGGFRIQAREKLLAQISKGGMSEADKKYAIREAGFSSTEASLLHRSRALEEAAGKKQQLADYHSLRLRTERYLAEQEAQGYKDSEWYANLLQAYTDDTLTESSLARAKQARKDWDANEARWQKDVAEKQKERERLEKERIERSAERAENIRYFEEEREKARVHHFSEGLQSRLEKEQKEREAHLKSSTGSYVFWAKAAAEQRKEKAELNKRRDYAIAHGDLFGSDIPRLEEAAAKGTKAYREELEKLTTRNEKILSVTKQMNASMPMYNPMRLFHAVGAQYGSIRGAAQGILPSFAERPLFRLGDALSNVWKQFEADFRYKYTAGSLVASSIGTGIGAALGGLTGNPAGVLLGANLGGLVGKGASQLAGGYAEKTISQLGQGIAHRLNLIGTVTTLFGGLADVLRLNISLFSRLTKLWEYMPSYTPKTLTGVEWSKAQPMLASDRLLGLQAGTTSSMYANLAYQQADLYTSGKFNEAQLVAAARLGIFDLAYAAPGGDIEAQQAEIYNRLYKNIYESSLSKGDIQQQLSLVRQYNPQMYSYLERGHGLVEAGYTQYRSYGAFSDSRGYAYLGEGENARVSMASTGWDMAKRSFTEGVSLLGAKAFDLAEPLIKEVDKLLWAAARGESLDMEGITKEAGKLFNKILGSIDFENIQWDEKLAFLNPIIEAIKNKLAPLGDFLLDVFSDFIDSMSLLKLDFRAENLPGLLAGSKTFGDVWSITTPQKVMEHQVNEVRNAFKDAKWHTTGDNYTSFRAPSGYSSEAWKTVDAIMSEDGKADPKLRNMRMSAFKAFASNKAIEDALAASGLWEGNAERAKNYFAKHNMDSMLAGFFKDELGLSDADIISLLALDKASRSGNTSKEDLKAFAQLVAEALGNVLTNAKESVTIAIENMSPNDIKATQYMNRSR